MHDAIKRLRFHGIKVFSVATRSDLTDYGGRVMATVVGLKDELFIDDLRAKTHRGMAGIVRRGGAAGGRAFGYRSEPVIDGQGRDVGRRRVVNEDEAKIVRYIFRLYAVECLTPRASPHRLNAEGITPPRAAHGRLSESWTPATITGSAARAPRDFEQPGVRRPRSLESVAESPGSRYRQAADAAAAGIRMAMGRAAGAAHRHRRAVGTGNRRGHGGPNGAYRSPAGRKVHGLVLADRPVRLRRVRRPVRRAVSPPRRPAFCLRGPLRPRRRRLQERQAVRCDVLAGKVLKYVFRDVLAPQRLDYLQAAADTALLGAGGQTLSMLGGPRGCA